MQKTSDLSHDDTFPVGYVPKTPWGKKLGRPLRLFGTPWHVAHQHELMKIPETKWTFLINPTRNWGEVARPQPENLSWAAHYDEGMYDIAILHIDQQCVHEQIGKGKLFREMNAMINDIPKILINHGTPFWPEMYGSDEIITKMREMIGSLVDTCVVNSKRASEMWGFGTPIIHGMESEEWFDLPKEQRIVTCISPGGLDKYYNRDLLRSVQELLNEKHHIRHCHITVDMKPRSFEEYRRFLGSSLIYFNPTLESPMPRARTEALLSGACVVTLNNHDIGEYLEDGVSAVFVKNNPYDCVEKLAELFYDYPRAIEIGKRGREVAQKHFSKENFQKQWESLLVKTLHLC